MGALARMRRGLGRIPHLDAAHGPGIVSHGWETVEYVGASYALGRLHGHYREKAAIKIPFIDRRVPLDLGVGFLGKAIVLGMTACGVNYGLSDINTVSNAGLGAYFHGLGVAHGTEGSGRRVYVLPPGAQAPAGLPAGTETVLGDLGQAPRGRFLNRDEILDLARMRSG